MMMAIWIVVLGIWGWFWTPDQWGDRLMRQGDFAAAAEAYEDPMRGGVALYRAGAFEDAASSFGRVKTADGFFNQGNALVMRGLYDDAVGAYEKALALRPGWPEAMENQRLARIRGERVRQEGGEMTGGMMEADDFVFDSGSDRAEAQETQMDGGEPISDEALQEMWLRRVQTKPADFLKAKFAAQVQIGDAE
jgi:Ca-activated chloride channel family protein